MIIHILSIIIIQPLLIPPSCYPFFRFRLPFSLQQSNIWDKFVFPMMSTVENDQKEFQVPTIQQWGILHLFS